MKKLSLAILISVALTGCNIESEKSVSIDNYWKDKVSSISDEKKDKLNKMLEGKVKRVLDSPAEMLYEVHLKDGKILYVSYDLSVVVKGELFSSKDHVNLTALSKEILIAESKVQNILNGKSEESQKLIQKDTKAVDYSDKSSLKNEKDEFSSFASEMMNATKEESVQPLFNENKDFEKLREKIQRRIEEKRKEIEPIRSTDQVIVSSENKPVVSTSAQSKSTPKNEFRTKNNVDVNHIKQDETRVNYKGTLISKIGYNNQGIKLSKDETNKQMLNLIEKVRAKGEEWSILYPSTSNERKGEIVVFTDPTCGYCKKFHARMNEITDKGYDVRYLFYPRYLALGMEHPNAQKNLNIIKSIWCADDRKQESHNIYVNNVMGGFSCENKPREAKLFPATDHYLLGLIAGVESTPTIILPNGEKVTGLNRTLEALK